MIFLFLNKQDLRAPRKASPDIDRPADILRYHATLYAYADFYREVARKAGRDILVYYTNATDTDQMGDVIREVFDRTERRWMK